MIPEKDSFTMATRLLEAATSDTVADIVKDKDYRYYFDDPNNWKPYGGREKNWDTVGNQQTNPVGALTELITNGIDAVLLRKAREAGTKDLRSPSILLRAVLCPDSAPRRFRRSATKSWELLVRARSSGYMNTISCAKPGESNRYLKNTPYGDLSLDCHRRLEEKWGVPSFSDTYTRMRGDDMAPTITTHCVSITNGRFGHYDVSQNRGITPREAALLQTFPENYIFYPEDNISLAATLIGNAVPPRLAQFYGSYLSKAIVRRSRKAI